MSELDTAKANSIAGRSYLRAGLLGGALTLVLYQLLLFSFAPEWSYAIAWAAGLALAALLFPPTLLSDARLGWQGQAVMAVIHVASFLLGLGILRAIVEQTGMERLAILASVLATAVFVFLAMRMAFRPAGQS
ncbi:hypothetical protein DLM45_00865 [Hyphomicrobium methylovorum]|uniref:hypothetical protein n=1 Tax=Hyphomicrobium methylovorum TaxID=84 RepID=UPI0015E712C1|nr:hypothetical protein [Hyphomicrobium methylovorum]MBA2124775.1 hypothetical protein [Hyphomicrobium methylovorum]